MTPPEFSSHTTPKDHLYRPNVGIILINSQKEVCVGRRCDSLGKEPSWQMPQGGIDPKENVPGAALRELHEELGVHNVEIIKISEDWYYYDLPKTLAKKLWKGRYLGQRQKWVLALFKGTESEIDLNTHRPEFCEVQWVPPKEVIRLIVPFKKALYKRVFKDFSAYL